MTLLEQVARAIFEAAKAEADALGAKDIPKQDFSTLPKDEQEFAYRMAQAAITAHNTGLVEEKRNRLLAVLGFYRDDMPPEAVKAFQELLVTDADRAALEQGNG